MNTPDWYVSHFFRMCQINPEILHICGNFSRMKLSVCKEQRITKEKVRQAMKGEGAKTDTKINHAKLRWSPRVNVPHLK